MEHHKISKLSNNSTVSKFVTRKWIEVNNSSGAKYSINKNLRCKTPMLRLYLCDYSDVYIFVKWRITVEGTDNANKRNEKLTFKNNALFGPYILEISNTFVDNAEDLDIVMLMYNLLEYSGNYSMASGSS